MWSSCVELLKSPVCLRLDSSSKMTDKSGDHKSSYSHSSKDETVMELTSFESYDFLKAKQQASVLWLMSKAYNNDIPSNLREPYYRGHEGQDQLKPHIVHALANAELYCLALGNIYADQNYHSLNHNGVMMLLQRKGVYVVEPADVSLTETVLVQVAPLRMTAHMAVIEAVMALYIKEVLIPDKIIQRIKKFKNLSTNTELPVDPESAVILWINRSCDKMKSKIEDENKTNSSSESDTLNQDKVKGKTPHIPVIQDLSDLSDGCCLALLLSFYCPEYFSWREICLNETLSLADSLYNLQLILKFCESVMPFNFYFLSLEDVLYMHSSICQNFLAFLADMFYNFEIKPAKCVKPPGQKDHKIHIPAPRSKPSSVVAGIHSLNQATTPPTPDCRNTNHTYEFSSPNSNLPGVTDNNGRKSFRNIKTPEGMSLKSPKTSNSPFYVSNSDHWDDSESPTNSIPAAGIRSGSKRLDDTLVPARLKVSKEKIVRESKKEERGEVQEKPKQTGIIGEANIVLTSITGSPRRAAPNCAPLASNLAGIPGFQSPCADTPEKSFEPPPHRESENDTQSNTNFAEMSQTVDPISESINNSIPQKSSLVKKDFEKADSPKPVKKTSFAAIPSNTTTWQQQFQNSQAEADQLSSNNESEVVLTSQLNNIKLELEEKRRNIELEKKKLELMWNNQRQKFGKAAFLQALNKNLDNEKTEPSSEGVNNEQSVSQRESEKEINNSQEKWSKKKEVSLKHDTASSQSERPAQKDFHTSIGQLNESLNDLQVDLSKLSKQQDMIHNMVHYPPKEEPKEPQQNFYLHNQQQTSSTQSNFNQISMNVEHSNSIAPMRQNTSIQPPQNPESFMHVNQPQMVMHHGATGSMGHHSLPPQMMHQQEHPTSQFQHQRGQWNVPIVSQDLSAVAPRRAQWNPPNPQSMLDTSHQQRQQWYLPQQNNAPIMSTGQYPMAYNPNYIGQDQPSGPYPMYQNGQMENPHYAYSSPYPPAQTTMYPPYSSQPVSTLPYQPPQPMQFRLHNQSAPLTISSNAPSGQQNMRPPFSNQPAPVHSNEIPVHKDPSQSGIPNVDNRKDKSQLPMNNLPNEVNNVETEECDSSRSDKHTLGKTFRVHKPRVTSPTAKQAVLPPNECDEEVESAELPTQPIKDGADNDLGFFVSFENEQPVKPKPKFRGKSGQMKTSHPSKDNLEIMDNPFRKTEDNIVHQNFDNPFRKNFSKEENSQQKFDNPFRKNYYNVESSNQKLENPFRRNVNIADKSSPLHHINEKNLESARSSSSSVPDVVSSPILRNDSRSSCNIDQDEEEEGGNSGVGFIIGADLVTPDPIAEDEMQKRKERIMINSLQRKAEQEAKRLSKERENAMQREQKRIEKEKLERKKEEEKMRRQMIFEQYKQRKQAEAEEAEGRVPEPPPSTNVSRTLTKTRPKSSKQRPKSQFFNSNISNHEYPPISMMSSRGSMRGSQPNLSVYGETSYDNEADSQTPMRRALSPPPGNRQLLSDPRLPGDYYGRPGPPSEASDTCSTGSALDYAGPRLFVKPTSKSNRGIIINAVNTVLGGYVNADAKSHVLNEINKCESKHFLILFRDQSLKFRGIYSYNPDREEVFKLYGQGPKQVTCKMMDKYLKYNSGAKSFSEIHTKHLTVTIDAITIHNSLWQGKSIKKIQPRRDYL